MTLNNLEMLDDPKLSQRVVDEAVCTVRDGAVTIAKALRALDLHLPFCEEGECCIAISGVSIEMVDDKAVGHPTSALVRVTRSDMLAQSSVLLRVASLLVGAAIVIDGWTG